MADVDKFKLINDNYGHGIGDVVLRSVAQKLAENIRETDVVGRYGGDEFVVVLSKSSPDEAQKIAQRILTSVSSITTGELPPAAY
jgi:diguanylate cyclase (GGDEF)-like protein